MQQKTDLTGIAQNKAKDFYFDKIKNEDIECLFFFREYFLKLFLLVNNGIEKKGYIMYSNKSKINH